MNLKFLVEIETQPRLIDITEEEVVEGIEQLLEDCEDDVDVDWGVKTFKVNLQ